MTTFKMFARLRWLVPRTWTTVGYRSQYVVKSGFWCTQSLCHVTPEVSPASYFTGVNKIFTPCRRTFRQTSIDYEEVNISSVPRSRRSKLRGRVNIPPISAASVIESVFEKKTTDALPSILSAQQRSVKDASSHLSTIRRRAFLSDSAAYRQSSLESLRLLEENYKDDAERKASFIEDVTSENISSYSSSEIITFLSSLSQVSEGKILSVFSSSLAEISDLACQNCSKCTDEEFCNVLLALYKIHVNASLTPEQQETLERECERRLHSWSVNAMLLVADWWVCIQRRSPFLQSVLRALSAKLADMTLQNIVQVFYVIGECQYVPTEEFLQEMTDLVEQHLDSLSWNEVGVVGNAFIKSRSRILSRPLQRSVSARIIQDLHTNSLDHYNLVTTMRFISRAYFHEWRLFEQIAHSLTPHIPDMPFLVPPHVATAFAKVRHFNQPLMDAIASRALQKAENIRIKDIWMLLWAFCRLNYNPLNSKDFFPGLIHHMAGKPELLDHLYQFIKTLVSLTFIGEYPTALINKAFSSEYLAECEEKCPKDVYKHLFALDCSVAIEQPEYCGNRLPQSFVDKFWESPYLSTEAAYEKITGLQEAVETVQSTVGGAEYLRTHPILPHIRTPFDIEVHLDRDDKPTPLTSESSCSVEELLRKHEAQSGQKDGQRLAILVAPRAHHRLRSRDLLGVHVMKRRQLRQVGYRVIEVPYYEWEPLLKTSESQRHAYLRAKIFS